MNDETTSKKRKRANPTLIGISVLVVAFLVAVIFVKTKDSPERRPPPRMVPVVEVIDLKPITENVEIDAMGTVIPTREINLRAQVSGEIIRIHPEFIEGGFIKEGEVIVEIDPRDYELAILRIEAQVETARNNLRMEQGQQEIAKREWEMMGADSEASELERELAQRGPQLSNLEASLAAANAELEGARLDLERTRVRAPFNLIVRSADVNAGDLAISQSGLGVLCGTDSFWVQTSVAVDRLPWVNLPSLENGDGSSARVTGTSAGEREGRVIKLYSDLEPNGRMARLLVEVEDPLQLSLGSSDRVPLLLGEFVRVQIEGRELSNVYRIPRDSLHNESEIWLVGADGRLKIRSVDPLWRGRDYSLVSNGIGSGDRLVLSGLATPVDGMTLRVASAARDPAEPMQEARSSESAPAGTKAENR